jgi:hypothetical protein
MQVIQTATHVLQTPRPSKHLSALQISLTITCTQYEPFISGAISKTVNMPQESTVEQIHETCIQGWKSGLKAIAIYRDGSKRTQPRSASTDAMKAGGKEMPRRAVCRSGAIGRLARAG